jgi:hypothetical protein
MALFETLVGLLLVSAGRAAGAGPCRQGTITLDRLVRGPG